MKTPNESVPHLPPGPWTYETVTAKSRPEGTGHVYLVDANGWKIASKARGGV